MPTKKSLANLRPIKKGERRAAKPAEKHRSNSIVFKVTDSELSVIADKVRESGEKSQSAYFRKLLSL